jgi:small conductance mechanosensitive channel
MAPAPPSLVGGWAAPASNGTAPSDSNWLTQLLEHAGVSHQDAADVSGIVLRPLELVLVVVGAILVAHFGTRAIRRGLAKPARRAADRMESERADARATTVVALVANLFRVTVGIVAALTVLGIMGINLTPILASATVIAATVAFGAQTLVRDYLSGILLSVEDQYRLGDSVDVNGTTGVIEDLSLRVTRLRAYDGTVWFVPNGDIRKLANLSRGWARAVVDVRVAPTGPGQLERLEDLLAEAAAAVVHGPRFAASTTEPVQMLGVVAADAGGCTLRLVARTSPDQRDALQRALTLASLEALAAEGLWPAPPAAPAGSAQSA